MTAHKTDWYPEGIPGFDCIKMKRDIQAQIYKETKHMTREEIRERLRQSSEQAALRRKALAERRAAEKQT
jgi:predicted HTH transcriptional regulator